LVGKHGFTRADVEDLEQELALQVWQRLQQAEDVDDPHAFAATVIKNCLVSYLRQHKAQKRQLPGTVSLDSLVDDPDKSQENPDPTLAFVEDHPNAKQPAGKSVSLQSMVQDPDGGMVSLASTIDAKERLAYQGYTSKSDLEQLELSLDVASILEGQPPLIHVVCQRLMKGDSLSQIATDMNLSISSLRRYLKEIFTAAGFSEIF
jgi:RNA polymerase sigma factor (sigma-70 family)